MQPLVRQWAGRDREFRLVFGDVLALEDACGGVAIGGIYRRLAHREFTAKDVFETIRLALIGGGETASDAKILMDRHFDPTPLAVNALLALEIIDAMMNGLEPIEGDDGDTQAGGGDASDAAPIKFSEASQICRVFSMSPNDLLKLGYADFVNMVRGFNASQPKALEPISEAEFDDILRRYEPDALNG